MSIEVPQAELADLCRRWHIRRLSLFGSVLGTGFRDNSDVDILVEFAPDYRIGLIGMARLERELSELFARKVDLRTPADLSRYFREDVLRQAQVQYAER